jgi:protein phosphatase
MRTASGPRDPAPVLSKVLETHAWKDGRVACGVASMRGFRAQMEDCASVLRPLTESSKGKYRFCGVFDGHAQSSKVAETLEELLPRRIGEQKQRNWMTRAGLEKACLEVDKEILRSEFSDAGSTAIFCVLESALESLKVSLASVGDSQAIIVHSDFAKPPTVPLKGDIHRPQLIEAESTRIKKAGGYVSNNRVDGELAVSRAFGDAKYKRNISLKLSDQKVIAVPAVVEDLVLHPGDVLVMGCDGLYDSMNAQQIDTFVRSTLISVLVKHKRSSSDSISGGSSLWNVGECLSEVAGLLVDEALLRGSRDNITVMLIQLSKKYEIHSLRWSDKFSRHYVPPIVFPSLMGANRQFIVTLRDELKTYCLDEDLTLSQSQTVSDLPSTGFAQTMNRAQMVALLQAAMNRQWEQRDTWVRLGEFEIPDNKFTIKKKRLNAFQKFIRSLACGATNEATDERKHRLSASVGGVAAFSKMSSVHVSSLNGTAFVVSSINSIPVTSRQTSADDEDELTKEMIPLSSN